MNFSTIDVTFSVLESTQVRRAIGDRVFNTSIDPPRDQNGVVGFLRGLLGGLGRLLGFVWRVVSWLFSVVNFSELWSTIQEATYAVLFFDWNQSDATIRQQILANNASMTQLLGRFAGSGVIRLVSVGIAAGAALKFPVVAGRIALELAEDSSGQVRGEFIGMLQGLRQLAIENALLNLVLGFRQRRWFGQQPRPNDGPYWSFSEATEQTVQRIQSTSLRNFVLGFLEGAEDAFWDVGYIVANTLDDIVAGSKFANHNNLGPERVVKVELDNQTEEAIVLAGPQQMVQQSVDQAIATHQMVWNRDMGQIVGIPSESFPRARHMVRHLVVCFKDIRQPPWRRPDGSRAKEVMYTIPDAKRGLSWGELKAAARPFTWGPWRATANLDNNRQMAVYGSSPSEAEGQLRSLLNLSTADIVTLSVSEERITNPGLVKHPTQVYPAYANLVTAPTDFQGQPISGTTAYRRERRRILLWTDTEPDDLGPLG